MPEPQVTNIRKLVINKCTEEQYNAMVKNADELYLTPDTGGSGSGTVTSVRVQAGTGLTSSQSTAQTQVLNTTISVASGYKLPTTTEWNNKQDALPSQSGQSGKFLTTDGSSLSWASAGGGGGTSDYDDLTDKPSINSVTLSGNQTGSDLGLVDEADLEEIDINNLVPDQTGNSGKYLTTNGTVVSWGDPSTKTIVTLTANQSSYTLTSNNIYAVSIASSVTTITFTLNTPSSNTISNDIIVHAYIGADSPTISWGTAHFFNNEIPTITSAGYYDITYVYNPLATYWVCKLNLVEEDL